MRAVVGDRLHVHGRVVGTPDQTLEIIEVRGRDGAPPYLVRRDGHEVLVLSRVGRLGGTPPAGRSQLTLIGWTGSGGPRVVAAPNGWWARPISRAWPISRA